MRTDNFLAEGTTCESCAKIIKRQAKRVDGVADVSFNYVTETGSVTYDESVTDLDTILYKIEEKGYTCFILDESPAKAPAKKKGWIFAVLGILVAAYFAFQFVDTIQMPTISQNMGYGLLFTVGLLTGFHCIGMCGGFVVSYTAKAAAEKKSTHMSHILYGSSKLLSYTIIGAVFGLIGSVIAFTPALRGAVGIFAGLFLVLFGLKMLNVFPSLRKVGFRFPAFIERFQMKNAKSHHPAVIGLLNGLMIACGPLQAIYIMAAGTGSPLEGAKLLFIFGLGTLPVMLGFGYFASYVSAKVTHKILKASAFIVIVLGVIMFNNGLVLTGSGYDVGSLVSAATLGSSLAGDMPTANVVATPDGYQEIHMEVNRYGWEPDTFVLKKGVPVRWIIDGKEINGCNNAIQVPEYGLKFDIKPGEQTIEFTPTESGMVRWSCWMGMIPGSFIVKDDIDINDAQAVKQEIAAAPPMPAGGSCGGGGSGGCGCGGGV